MYSYDVLLVVLNHFMLLDANEAAEILDSCAVDESIFLGYLYHLINLARLC